MTDITKRYRDIAARRAEQDRRHRLVSAARRGDVHELLPGMFPEEWPQQATANITSIASQDVGEMLGPLPAVNCRPRGSSQAAMKRASLKTRIAANYIEESVLDAQMPSAGDRFASFGFLPLIAEMGKSGPIIRPDSPQSAYYTLDLQGHVVEYFKRWNEHTRDLAAKFPELESRIRTPRRDTITGAPIDDGDGMLEVIKAYYWEHGTVHCKLFVPERDDLVLRDDVYPELTRMPVTVAERMKWDEEVRGQFDQSLWVSVLRARLEIFTMQAADEAINAPISVPRDVDKVPSGPRAIIRTDSERPVARVRLDIPNGVFAENTRIQQEERIAARYPEGRSGNIDASVITGQGVQALLGTMDSQLKNYQNSLGRALKDILSVCFEMDEKYYTKDKKHIEGTLDGELFEETYEPGRDIAQDYRVDVSYGFAAGLDPNRALVFLLQLRGDRMVDRDTVMRQLPFDVDVQAMKERIDGEEIDDALKQGVFAMAQQIGQPEFAGLGIDPRKVVEQLGKIKELRTKGKSLHEAVLKALEPTKEEQAAAEAANASPLDQLMQEDQALSGGGGELPARGLGSPQAGSTGDIQMLLAGLTGGGNPNLQANVSRMRSA